MILYRAVIAASLLATLVSVAFIAGRTVSAPLLGAVLYPPPVSIEGLTHRL
jgi:hypothetical protein